jgi:putative membrane protein
VLIPIGLTLLVFPILATAVGPAEGAAAITTVIGLFLLYKGFNVDELLTRLARGTRESLYSGQVSVVTYVVAAGLTFVGLFVGALGVSGMADTPGVVIPATRFAFDSVPWLAMAALTASAGRLLDEAIGDGPIRSSFLNLPFIVVAVGLVVRGFAAYFLEQQGEIDPIVVPAYELGILSNERFVMGAGERLALFVVTAIVVSLVGAQVAAYVSGSSDDDADGPPSGADASVEHEGEVDRPDPELTDGGPGPAAGADSSGEPDP